MNRPARAALLGAAVLLLTTACTPDASAPDATASSSPPTTTAATTASVPVQSTAASGSPRLTLEVSLAGGAPFTVMLDTGSSGLYVEQSAVGPDAVATGTTTTQRYVQDSVTADVSTGVLSLGDVDTDAGFAFGIVPDGSGASAFGGTQGILGIAPMDGGTEKTGMMSALLRLPAPYDQGYTIDVPSSGAGTLVLGRPAPAAGAVSVALQPEASAPTPPAGVSFFQKPVTLCWTIAALASSCGGTVLDTGAPRTAFDSGTVSGPATGSGGVLDAGQQVAVATPDGTALWSFTTGTTAGADEAVIESLGDPYNTGIGFFFRFTVAEDWTDGTLYLTPKDATP